MTENEYLKMPWSIEDTIENLNEIKENFKVILITKNLDGKASDDVKELEFDFDRAIKALEKQIPKKPYCVEDKMWCCPVCDNNLLHKRIKYPTRLMPKSQGFSHCTSCGQAIDWSEEE